MRTNIDIDDELLGEAQRLTGIDTKKGVVEEALKTLVQLKRQAAVKTWRGQLKWEGDLESMRLDEHGCVGTYCIAYTLPLLYSDRDFDPMVQHLGLLSIDTA